MRIGRHLVKSWSKDQGTIATSSGEAELYAVNRAAQEARGLKSISEDLGMKLEITMEIDAKATMGMVARTGLGKMRHLAVAELWLQDAVRTGRVKIRKVSGKENTADMLTKHIGREDIEKYMKELNCNAVEYIREH